MRIMLSQYLPHLASHLADRGDQVSWLAGKDELAIVDSSATFGTGYPYDGRRAKISASAVRQMRQAILSEKPDLVHAFLGRPLAHLILATVGMKNRPRIASFRGITAVPTYGDPANWISYLHPRVDAHACESEAVRQAMIAGGIAPEKCKTVYNFVTPHIGQPSPAVADFGFSKSNFVIGSVATARPVKGIDLLLRAMLELDDIAELRLLLVGKIKDRRVAKLLKHPRLRERVCSTGFRTDVRDLMRLMQVFVMPSRAEALCRAVLEAMHAGRCMLVSDAGGLKEAVRHQQDGLVVPRNSPTQLAQAIRLLYESPAAREDFADSAKDRALAFFSPEQWSARLAKLYDSMLSETLDSPDEAPSVATSHPDAKAA